MPSSSRAFWSWRWAWSPGYRLPKEPLNREGVGAIPPSLVDIANDVLASMASDIGSGFITFAIVLTIVGLALAVGSTFIRMTRIPFLSK